MQANQPSNIERIEELLEVFVSASIANQQRSDERLTRLELIVESNNRSLEAFSQDLRKYTQSMHSLASRMDGVIAAGNEDRQDISAKLSRLSRQVKDIANHLGVD